MSTDLSQPTVFAPDILAVPEDWRDRSSWHFESFVMHSHTDVCSTCGSVSHYSNVFRMFTRKLAAATDRRMIPADRVPSELSVILYSMPERRVPLCHFCLSESRLTSTRILVTSEREWNEAKRREIEARASAPRPKASGPDVPPKSLSDLLGL